MKLTRDNLIAIIEAHEKQSLGGEEGELANDRADAIDRYFGEPYGDEVDGRSTVVSKDFKDAIDWIMPSLLRVFLSTSEVVRFDPVGPEDEQQAEQESDYTNHVIMKENNGFIVLHDWFKDGLMLKNGYVKHWWDESETTSHETYENLTEDELVQLLSDQADKIDIVGKEIKTVQNDLGQEVILCDIKIRRTKKIGAVRIEPIPPEEIRVSKRTRGELQKSPFVAHITRKTRSELIELGMEKDFVNNLSKWGDDKETPEHIAREQTEDESGSEEAFIDRSMDEIEYKEAYLKVDWDDDGIAELRKVVVVGGKIPDGDDWNEEIDSIPVSYLTPNRMPHRHVGMGLHDDLEDIARIKTTLWRQMLDNTYLLNNIEWLVNERVNVSDFMTSRPGGLKRVLGMEPIGDAATPVQKTPIIQHVLPVLDYMDTVKEDRTGVGRNVMGLDPDTLKKTTEGAARMALQQANAKIEMIARILGETGVKDLMLAVHALLIKHQNKEKVVRLRNNWVPVNPQTWRDRTDVTVNVGLGTGSQEELRSNLLLMAQLQERAAAAGIVTPRNVYNLAEDISDALGFKQQGKYFSDPNSPEAQAQNSQEQSDPLVEAEKVKAQSKEQIEQLKAQLANMKESLKMDFERWKFQQEHALNIVKAEIEAAKNLVPADLGQPGLGTETKQDPLKLSIAELQEVSQAASNGNIQMAEMLAQLVQQNQQVLQAVSEALSRPRNVVLHRDKDGRAVGATSTIQ